MKLFSYRYLPLNIYLAYSLFVLFALGFGPVKYVDMNYLVVYSYLFVFLLLFSVSFIIGSKGTLNQKVDFSKIEFHRGKIFKFFLISGLFIAFKMWVEFIISGNSLSLSTMGSNYVNSYAGYVRGQGSIGFSYIFGIFEQAIITISLLLIFSNYKWLKGRHKSIALFIIFTYLLVNVIGSGKQKYLGDLIVFLGYAYLVNIAVEKKRINFKKIFYYCASFIIVICIFSYILASRYLAIGITGENISRSLHHLMYWDNDSPIIMLLGDDLGFPVGMFLGYFTNGLYGLNVCLSLPFEWTYFLGSSYSLAKIIEVALGEPGLILQHSYPFRAESLGWGLDKWHSVFSWFASDVTFIGVLVLGSIFGFLYGHVWKISIQSINPFARPLFMYLSLGVVFSYSNNQLLHSLSGVIALFTLFLLCLLAKRH